MSAEHVTVSKPSNTWRMLAMTAAVGLSFIFGLALSRILYEGLFPQATWLGRPAAAIAVALISAGIGWLHWRWLTLKLDRPSQNSPQNDLSLLTDHAAWTAAAVFFPLILNLLYLLNRSVNLSISRFLFFASFWLTIVILIRLVARSTTWRWLSFVLLAGYIFAVYLATLGQTVGTADTFEFQVVVPQLGIAHPTGYPLYLLLSKPFSWLPFNSVAWRVNLATAVFATAAVCLLYLLGWRLLKRSLTALVAATMFGLSSTFWLQATQAEVYTLHALIVITALTLMREIGAWRLQANIYTAVTSPALDEKGPSDKSQATETGGLHPFLWSLLLALVLGFGLTNHLTTIILLPAASLTLLFAYRAGRFEKMPVSRPWSFLLPFLAFLTPLLLYAYLPLRWRAVNGDSMGLDRFVDWVIGGRFQGALQLNAWFNDATRYDIVGRLLSAEWFTFWTLLVIFVGAAYLILWQWRYGLILLTAWLGTVFYALNYYVPDLAVFIIPGQIVMALWWSCGIAAALDLVGARPGKRSSVLVQTIFLLAGLIPFLAMTAEQTLHTVIQAQKIDSTRWAEAVLKLDLAEDAAILADSDKFPALYYLQQAENYRPDLDIILLPDEASYRTELDSRLASGQTVYLARFLPGLEGIYHLYSKGPLTAVSTEPVTVLPAGVTNSNLTFGPIRLLGFELLPSSPFAPGESSVTFYWQSDESLEKALHVYTRWMTEDYIGPASSQHPANNMYPTPAWLAGEIVADYHSLIAPARNGSLSLQVALAPPFTDPDTIDWQTVAVVDERPMIDLSSATTLRSLVGKTALEKVAYANQLRPLERLEVGLAGFTSGAEQLMLTLLPKDSEWTTQDLDQLNWQVVAPLLGTDAIDADRLARSFWITSLTLDLPVGTYDLVSTQNKDPSYCGWFSRAASGCVLGQLSISGVPLPDEAVNFDDTIALLSVDIGDTNLVPGGQLAVDLSWLALSPIDEDYTVFVQVLDENDRIVGQVDSWPVQGTYPTSQWQPGETIDDPYVIQLTQELVPGEYKLNVGLYLLETLRRLPIVDETGTAVDDKWEVPGLTVEP